MWDPTHPSCFCRRPFWPTCIGTFPTAALALAILLPAKFVAADSPSAERVHVAPGNADEITIKTQLSTVAEMASTRNLDGYLECFSASARKKLRENGYWKISSEKIQQLEYSTPCMCSPSRYACLGGACVRIQ